MLLKRQSQASTRTFFKDTPAYKISNVIELQASRLRSSGKTCPTGHA